MACKLQSPKAFFFQNSRVPHGWFWYPCCHRGWHTREPITHKLSFKNNVILKSSVGVICHSFDRHFVLFPSLFNAHRNPVVELTRRHIGRGVRLFHLGGMFSLLSLDLASCITSLEALMLAFIEWTSIQCNLTSWRFNSRALWFYLCTQSLAKYNSIPAYDIKLVRMLFAIMK